MGTSTDENKSYNSEKINEKIKKKSKISINNENCKNINKNEKDYDKSSEDHQYKKDKPQNKITEDGFKVVNDIPPDDSDISDAFDSDEDLESNDGAVYSSSKGDKPRYTNDGFEIVNEIPPDDSDIESAFSSDEDFDVEESQEKTSKPTNIMEKFMKDFGIDKDFLKKKKNSTSAFNTNNKNVKKQTLANKGKVLPAIEVIDYSKKRGKKRKIEQKEENPMKIIKPPTNQSKDDDSDIEKAFNKAKHEVFRFGMDGFDKRKKQETRIALLVSLGAKPPKNKNKNYKEFQVERKQLKEQQAEECEVKRKLGLKV